MAKIRNKRTGEIVEVPTQQLGQYGLGAPTPQPTIAPNIITEQQAGPDRSGLLYNKTIPTAGGILGGILGGVVGAGAGGVGAIPGAGLGGAVGYGAASAGMESLQDLLKKQEEKPIEQVKRVGLESARAGAEQAAGEGLGGILAKVGGKILGPTVSKLKPAIPKGIQTQAGKLAGEVSEQIGSFLNKFKGKYVNTQPIISELDELVKTYQRRLPAAVPKIEKVRERISKYGSKIPVQVANELRLGLGEEVYGQAGKELSKRGTGVAEKKAMQAVGGELRKGIAEATDKKVMDELFKQYGTLKSIEAAMNQPYKGGFSAAVGPGALALLTSMINPALSAPLGAIGGAATLAAMPYTRLLSQMLLGKGAQAAGLGAKALAQPVGNLLLPDVKKKDEENVLLEGY